MPKWLEPVARSKPGRLLIGMVERYFTHDVGRQSAALAYYLLFTICPLLIFLSSLLGLLDLNVEEITSALRPVMPGSVIDIVEMYLLYVAETSSRTMLWFGLVFTIYFPTRAADCLMRAVRRAYGLGEPKNPIFYTFKVLLYTVSLLVAGAVTLFLSTMGRQVLAFLKRFITIPIPIGFVDIWSKLRFLIIGVVAFGAVGLLYAASHDRRQTWRRVIPGALCAVVGWLLLSAAYSFYVEHFANYSVVYGTLGAVIVLMIWLSLTATVLIMGAEVNGALGELSLRDF